MPTISWFTRRVIVPRLNLELRQQFFRLLTEHEEALACQGACEQLPGLRLTAVIGRQAGTIVGGVRAQLICVDDVAKKRGENG